MGTNDPTQVLGRTKSDAEVEFEEPCLTDNMSSTESDMLCLVSRHNVQWKGGAVVFELDVEMAVFVATALSRFAADHEIAARRTRKGPTMGIVYDCGRMEIFVKQLWKTLGREG